MKKILSVILALSMILTLGVTAFADEVVYGQSSGTLVVGKTYPFTFSVNTTDGVLLSDSNGLLGFTTPVVSDGFVAVNVTAKAGSAGKITKLVIKANNSAKTILHEEFITIENPSSSSVGTGQTYGYLEVGKTYPFSFNVDTTRGASIKDSNGLLIFGNPVLTGNALVVNVSVPLVAAGKVTKITIRTTDAKKDLLYEGYVTIAEYESSVVVVPSTGTTTTTPSTGTTTTTKPNTNTGANSAASAVVALAVMGAVAVVAKKVR